MDIICKGGEAGGGEGHLGYYVRIFPHSNRIAPSEKKSSEHNPLTNFSRSMNKCLQLLHKRGQPNVLMFLFFS